MNLLDYLPKIIGTIIGVSYIVVMPILMIGFFLYILKVIKWGLGGEWEEPQRKP